MVYDVNNRPEKCPVCHKGQCRKHEVEYRCIQCGNVRNVKVATVELRPGRGAPTRCRSCSKKVENLSNETRIKLSENSGHKRTSFPQEWKDNIGKGVRKAYAERKREPMNTMGKSHNFTLKYPNGEEFWVQGTYEKRYAEHLLEEGIEFVAHPKGLKWLDENGTKHTYFPDFWLPRNSEYVDVKSEWTMTDEYFDKIDAVQAQNGVIVTTILLD